MKSECLVTLEEISLVGCTQLVPCSLSPIISHSHQQWSLTLVAEVGQSKSGVLGVYKEQIPGFWKEHGAGRAEIRCSVPMLNARRVVRTSQGQSCRKVVYLQSTLDVILQE